ncbi:MAG: ABC transporter permease [Spirochaetaceae bacterium]|jgi:ribose transport system permease protein|nr:ABC transporter permease [Spirochaetaceae bacterium]
MGANFSRRFTHSFVTGFKANVGLIIGLIVLCVIVAFQSEFFLTGQNLINVARQISTNLFVASACTMILITGGIDLASGSIISVSGVFSAAAVLKMGLPVGAGVALGIAIGAAAGFVNGFILSRTALPPFIITYAVGSICKGVSYVYTGGQNIRVDAPALKWFGTGFVGPIPAPVFFLLIILIAVWLILNKTKLGRNMYAVGGNVHAAEYAGINIKRIRVFMYVFSGAMAAFAGIILAARTYSGQPAAGAGAEMDAIAACVLGGVSMLGGNGRLSGTILGAVIIGVLNNGLNLMHIDSFWQYIVKGVVIIAAVYFDYYKSTLVRTNKALKGASKKSG